MALTPEEERELEQLELMELEALDAASTTPTPAPQPETQPAPQPVPEEEQGLLGRSYDTLKTGVSDAFSTLAGDTYGRSGDPTQQDDLNPLSRAIKAAGGDILPAVGNVGGDVLIEAGKGVLNDEQEQRVASDAQKLLQGRPAQAISRGLDKAKEYLGPEGSALAGEIANIAGAVAPAPKLGFKFGNKSRNKLVKSLQDRKRLETERLLEPNPNNMEGKGELLEEGLLRSRVYKPGVEETRKAKLVSEIPDVDPTRSNNYNTGVLKNEIGRLNTELVGDLDGVKPVSVETITNSVDDAIDIARQTPNLAGEAGAMADTLSAYVDRLITKYKNPNGDVSPGNLLKIRRELDDWTRKYGPKDLYGDKGSALGDANDAIRLSLNQTLADSAPNAEVRQKLWNMADIIEAKKLTYERSLPGKEKGNRITRYIDNLERSTGIKHPTNPQSIAITAGNPVVGAGAAAAALGLGAKKGLGKAVGRNKTAIAEMSQALLNQSLPAAERAAILAALQDEEENN